MNGLVRLSIADFLLAIELPNQASQQALETAYQGFVVPSGKPDVHLHVHDGSLPDLNGWQKLFDSGSIWTLWQHQDRYAIALNSPVLRPNLYQIAVFSQDFQQGDIYVQKTTSSSLSLPFEHLLAEILVVNLLSQGEGVLLHASAVKEDTVGRLFTGHSGAGKSTMAKLWKGAAVGSLLSDDRVVARKKDGRFWIYGTPWHGTARIASPDLSTLDQIFVLKQALYNKALRLRPADAAARLMARSFPSFWSPQRMDFTLGFLAEMSQVVPCYELSFTPQPDIVEYVRCLQDI